MAETVAQTISWPILRKHLEALSQRALDQMEDSEGVEMHRLQGELRTLKKLRNLPETLAMIDAEDRRAAEAAK